MKVSKTILSALLVGITVQGAVSCTKDKDISNQKQKENSKKEGENKPVYPDTCIACGMG